MPLTLGFRARWLLEEPYDAHAQDFGAADEAGYEAQADVFLGGPLGATTIECRRSFFDNALVRYDYASQAFGVLSVQAFGVLSVDNYILTYYKPDPAEHGRSTNRAYFEWQKMRRR